MFFSMCACTSDYPYLVAKSLSLTNEMTIFTIYIVINLNCALDYSSDYRYIIVNNMINKYMKMCSLENKTIENFDFVT